MNHLVNIPNRLKEHLSQPAYGTLFLGPIGAESCDATVIVNGEQVKASAPTPEEAISKLEDTLAVLLPMLTPEFMKARRIERLRAELLELESAPTEAQ